MFCMFSGVGLVTFLAAVVIALNLENFFQLTPEQVRTGQIVFLFISGYVALGFRSASLAASSTAFNANI